MVMYVTVYQRVNHVKTQLKILKDEKQDGLERYVATSCVFGKNGKLFEHIWTYKNKIGIAWDRGDSQTGDAIVGY